MEKPFREIIADLFKEAEYEDSPYNICIIKLLLWLGLITIVSSLTPFIVPGGHPLIKNFSSLIIFLSATAHPAFKWASKLKKYLYKNDR